jgi:toxin ParE1/3/4
MSGIVHRLPAARQDLIDLADYLAQRAGLRTADRFLDAADQTFATLAAMPEMGSPYEFASPRLQGVRSWPIKGFPNHIVYYRPVGDGIEVLHVFQGARDITDLMENEA